MKGHADSDSLAAVLQVLANAVKENGVSLEESIDAALKVKLLLDVNLPSSPRASARWYIIEWMLCSSSLFGAMQWTRWV